MLDKDGHAFFQMNGPLSPMSKKYIGKWKSFDLNSNFRSYFKEILINIVKNVSIITKVKDTIQRAIKGLES